MLVCRQQPAAVLIRVGMKAATYRWYLSRS
jgi:hypothetical protein